jgi:hypothetical protein
MLIVSDLVFCDNQAYHGDHLPILKGKQHWILIFPIMVSTLSDLGVQN